MSNLFEMIKLAWEIGLEGDDLKSYVKEKETKLRELGGKEREARRRDQEHEKNLKRIEAEKEKTACTQTRKAEFGI